MSDAHGIARDQLRAFISRIERLEEEKKTIADDIKDVYGEAKGMGFDTGIMKKVVALRKKDAQQRMEEEAVLDTYLAALGMLSQHDLFEPDPAPTTNKPAMALQSPRQAAEAVSERAALTDATRAPVLVEADKAEAVAGVLGQPETIPALTVQHDGVNVGGPERAGVTVGGDESGTAINPEMDREEMRGGRAVHSLAAENARKAVPETEDGSVTHAGAGEIPATHSEIDPNEDRSEGQSLGGGLNAVGANTGGDHVTAPEYAATHQAGASFKAPPAKPLRPNCLRPENCGGFGSNHCYSCGKAAKADEVAA